MIFLIFRKCSEIMEKFANVIGTVRKRSQELTSIGADFEMSLKGHQHSCCAQVMTGK